MLQRLQHVTGRTIEVIRSSIKHIAGRLPENSRTSFVDLQSQKNSKKTDQKNRLFIKG